MVHASWCPAGAPEGREAPKKEALGKLGTFHLAMSWRIILASVLWSIGPLERVTAGLHLALGSCVLLTDHEEVDAQVQAFPGREPQPSPISGASSEALEVQTPLSRDIPSGQTDNFFQP
uniref:Uncharacterized protein n=1 Tax=Rangifer tarandus platyrhynchus TaxID=3082113 RepID=A0ACB0FLY8_RANTA|nr:unnamed protein product [Rangifer tarandus platyrhynchus]